MTRPPEFRVFSVAEGQASVRVVVEGELDLATAPELERALEAHRGNGRHVVLDLGGLEFIDSTGMRSVYRAVQDAKMDGWNLGIKASLTQPVRRAFELTELLAELPLIEA